MGRVCPATLAVTRHTHSGPRLRELQAASAALGGIGAARSSRGESRRFGTEEETTRKERPLLPALLAFLIATIAAFGFGEPVQAATKVTVGVLKFGTVSWVLTLSRRTAWTRPRASSSTSYHSRAPRRPPSAYKAARSTSSPRIGCGCRASGAAAPTSPSRPSPRRSAPSWFPPIPRLKL